jgi:hypothetical protein
MTILAAKMHQPCTGNVYLKTLAELRPSSGPGSLDLYRVCQIADALDVSLDWLMGRSNVISVMEMSELPEPPKNEG